jgi:hypothetical protein
VMSALLFLRLWLFESAREDLIFLILEKFLAFCLVEDFL